MGAMSRIHADYMQAVELMESIKTQTEKTQNEKTQTGKTQVGKTQVGKTQTDKSGSRNLSGTSASASESGNTSNYEWRF